MFHQNQLVQKKNHFDTLTQNDYIDKSLNINQAKSQYSDHPTNSFLMKIDSSPFDILPLWFLST